MPSMRLNDARKCVSLYILGYSKFKNYMENHILMTHIMTPSWHYAQLAISLAQWLVLVIVHAYISMIILEEIWPTNCKPHSEPNP